MYQFRYWGFANSIRPLSVHATRGTILPAQRAQKLSPEISVELVGDQEVFAQPADGTPAPPPGPAHQACPSERPSLVPFFGLAST